MRNFKSINILMFFAFYWILLSPFSALSPAAYYVSTTGSDTNPGTLSQPFRTIQKCATVAVAGDTCYVRAGTYRETVSPANSGTAGASITFTPYQGESVTISGNEVITGWTVHSGAIYKSGGMTWDLGVGKNQVFVDGQMMIEARWPNTSLDVSNPVWAVADQGQGNGTGKLEAPNDEIWVLSDSDLTHPAGFWDGATIHFLPVNESISVTGWYRQSGTVTRQTKGKVEFDPFTTRYGPRAATRYYLTGKFEALDTGGEWFQQGNTLYLWTPQGDNPSRHVIEAKKRSYAFDFSDRSYITIERFKIFAAGINMNVNTSHVVIDGIRAKYTSHFTRIINPRWPGLPQGSLNNDAVGILLDGKNNTLQNCEIVYSAGSGVDVIGCNHKVHNCIIHGTDYTATYSGVISTSPRIFPGTRIPEGPSIGHVISHNTLYDTSASVLQHSRSQSLKILNNHMYNAGLQTTDNGFTYAAGTDGAGTVIAYNWMHDHKASGGIGNGIYLDNSSSNFIVHHNVIWNVPNAGVTMVHISVEAPATHNWNTGVYNNSFWNVGEAMDVWPSGTLRAVRTYNNLSNRGSFLGDDQRNNLITSHPRFVDPTNGDFRLQSGSPAIDRGRVISGITDGYVGAAPDIGAYEFGAPAWTAGANLE